MAKYTVTRSCGHDEVVSLVGPTRDREWRLEHVEASKLCTECYLAELARRREEENKEAAEAAQEQSLPSLTGSEKQVAWAETVRQQLIASIDKYIYQETTVFHEHDEIQLREALEQVKKCTEARWWIDHRYLSTSYEYRQLLADAVRESKKEQLQAPKEVVADAKAEATVRPEHPKTDTVAEIRALEDSIEISFPERRDDFRELAKKRLKMEWDNKWVRKLKPKHGTPTDRAAEAGHLLLANGFPIRIYDEEIRRKAISGEYEPECTRWVMGMVKGEYLGWFSISWGRDEDFYKAARLIPGSKYDKPSVVVPAEQFELVLDFAKMYNFKLSETAQEFADTARTTKDNILVVKVGRGPEQDHVVPLSKPPALEVPDNVTIADEFKD